MHNPHVLPLIINRIYHLYCEVCVCVCVLGCVSLEMILIRHVVSWRVPAHTPGKVVLRFQIN